MSNHVRASALAPPQQGDSYDERWNGEDQGAICCWLRGRELRTMRPELAAQAVNGELPVLPWKGGVRATIKTKQKVGAMQYLAAWQGLRGDDLDVNLEVEKKITCTRTGVIVTFTSSLGKLLLADDESAQEE